MKKKHCNTKVCWFYEQVSEADVVKSRIEITEGTLLFKVASRKKEVPWKVVYGHNIMKDDKKRVGNIRKLPNPAHFEIGENCLRY